MSGIQIIPGEVVREDTDSEQWEFYQTTTEKIVTGGLRDKVLARVGGGDEVRSIEIDRSDGTCEICGVNSLSIRLTVDGVEVYYGDDYSGFDYDGPRPNPFMALNEWLNET